MMILIFLISFLQVGLVSFNVRNTSQARYLSAFITSILITSAWGVNIKLLALGHYSTPLIIATAFGGACGVVVGMWTHKRFMKKKSTEDW